MAVETYSVPDATAESAWCDRETYDAMYQRSITDPEGFWAEHGRRIAWFKPFTKVEDTRFGSDGVHIRWFHDGTTNACYNCLDRHLPRKENDPAIIWEGDEPDQHKTITFRQALDEVSCFANVLKRRGVGKGDRVTIYMPMIPEAVYAMLACARIGAVHSVVFGGFSPDALADRILDADAGLVITADEGVRGGKRTPLKANTDEALQRCPGVHTVLVVQRTGAAIAWNASVDCWYHEECEQVSAECPAEEMNAEDPLFILYTSGSTGKPKGVLHTTGGYLVHTSMTHQYVFDYKEGEVYWCTADVGWITGHSYIVYGPLTNGATTLVFEGTPTYPDASRHWQVVDKHQVNIYYTAPTAIRALMREGDAPLDTTHRDSLRILGTVGEPINPEAWRWFHRAVGKERCPVVDTWWQTETGGIMITPLPGATPLKPGSTTLPFFGVRPVLVDNNGEELSGEARGNLCIADSWPGQMRTVYGDHDRFIRTYFSSFPGYYFSGDGAVRDGDGYYWITGRVDDVLNISGHRLGTAEVESALVLHGKAAEAAVVGYPHDIKGQGVYAYVTLLSGETGDDELRHELIDLVRREIGGFARPDIIQFVTGLPKTRSGKIMRRILRKVAEGEPDNLGDTSTLADPTVVDELLAHRRPTGQ